MAIKLRDRYGNRANEPSIDYPTGSVKNKSSPDANDGTPLEKDWANDFLGTRDAILKAAGIVADGNVETAENSQVLEALNALYKALSTEDLPGIIQIAKAAEAKALTDNTKAITPKNLGDAMNAHVLGMGQTWQDVTASRAPNTIYTNTTGRTITINIFFTGYHPTDASAVWLSRPNDTDINVARHKMQSIATPAGATARDNLLMGTVVVPAGRAYRYVLADGHSIYSWLELR